ncbi:MAG: tetratricopeptide repeat protein [Polyangiaceae bacterium]
MAINRDKVLQEAQKLVEKKRFDKAILEYQKVVAEDPSDVRVLLKIGDLHLKLEQYAEAISLYERVGQYYSSQGFSVKAVAVFKQIRDIIQKHVPHLEDRFGHIVPKLAELLTSLGLVADAVAYYDEMATRFQRAGRDRDAIDVFRKIVQLDKDNPLSHLRLADSLVRVRDLDGAVEEYGIAGEILLKIGRQEDALRVVERILQHRQDAKYARLAAEIYLSRGQPSDGMAALTKLQLCFKENPKDLDTLACLARAFDQLGQPQKAIEVQKEAARIAKEGSRVERFEELLATLKQRAPNDEVVKQLAAGKKPQTVVPPPKEEPAPKQPAPRDPRAAAATEGPLSESIEVVDDYDLLDAEPSMKIPAPPSSRGDDEAPFQLRQSAPPAQGKAEVATRIRDVVAQVEALRIRGDYHHAILTLQTAVSAMPSGRELREKLCDLLIESGNQDQAIVEMLGFAAYLAQSGDGDGAARLLDEVLLLDAANTDALQMLQALGYAVSEPVSESVNEIDYDAPELPPPTQAPFAGYNAPAPAPNVTGPYPNYGDRGRAPDPYAESAPLPAFDLEADETAQPTSTTAHGAPPASQAPLELDDPFGGDAARDYAQYAAAQPAYAYPPSPADAYQPPTYVTPVPGAGGDFADEATSYGISADPSLLHPAAPRLSDSGQLDEAALEEIEFFQTHGMLEEAQGLLAEQLARLPNHPLLLERKHELDQLMYGGGGAVAPPADAIQTQPLSREPASQVDRSFDIASALEGLDALDLVDPAPRAPLGGGGGAQQVSVEAVFEQFKAGVAAQIADNDAATHYDLGVAYKEMGLFADSIAEFELASRDPTRECVSQSMIGMMHMERGNIDQAIDAFLRGLSAEDKSADQEIALTYEIANAYETRRNLDQALYYFQLVSRLNPSYRDPRGSVEERIGNLTEPASAAPRGAAVGALDEFDEAFDDLFDPKKK